MNFVTYILVFPLLFSNSLCEITEELKAKLSSDFINYYNLQPSHDHSASDGYLQSIREIDSTTFAIEISFSVKKGSSRQMMKCFVTVKDLGDSGIALVNNDIYCSELQTFPGEEDLSFESAEAASSSAVHPENVIEPAMAILGDQNNMKGNVDGQSPDDVAVSKDHVKVVLGQRQTDNDISVTKAKNQKPLDSKRNRQKAIDEMLEFLNFSGVKARPQQNTEEMIPRVKRSYDYDLQILSLTEDYRDLKNSIENAKYVYEMAQIMVDYLNEVDMEVKNRAVKHVIKAEEEEEENDKRYTYIQAQVIIPCSVADCGAKEGETKICNGVIDSTRKNNPHILSTFCYIDNKEIEVHKNVKDVALDDPVLLRLTKEVLSKMESESSDSHAIKIKKLVGANTRLVSGRVTKITIVVERLNCNKSMPLVLRTNCTTLQNLGSNICEVIVHEKHWLKEKKISYTCTERPIDLTMSKATTKQYNNILNYDDPKIIEILEEALQYLETQSDKKYKQNIVNINKISTQIIGGFLINIEFVVGYTNCSHSDDFKTDSGKCELLRNEPLRKCKAQIWDRAWILDGRQMEVSCDENMNTDNLLKITRKKRNLDFVGRGAQQTAVKDSLKGQPLPGGRTEQNPEDPKYLNLANESLQKHILDTGNSKPYKVVTVEKVTTQVVSGSMIRIDFVAIPTDGSSSDSIKCHSKIWEQPWVPRKDITVTCQNGNRKAKRETMPGGEAEQDPSDHEYLVLANESLQKYLSNTGNPKPHKVVTVDKVTTQVVSGSMTRIDFAAVPTDGSSSDTIKCHSEIWEQPWVPRKDITVTCQNGNRKAKRETMPGGETEQDPSDHEYLVLANESLQKYLSNTGNPKPHKVVTVDKVTIQVVSGSMTRIDFVAIPTDESSGDSIKCHSEIWEQPWVPRKDITVTCQNGHHKVKREVIGAPKPQDPASPEYLQLANESLQKYLSNTGNPRPHKVIRVEAVSKQVVSGSITRIIFVAAPTDESSSATLACHSKIWEEPWVSRKDITVNCQNINHKVKRDLIGAPEEQNPAAPEYLQLANESLQKYLLNTGNPKPHKVVTVDKVTTQVVSGSMTRIDFVAIPNDGSSSDSIKCHSEIWEQPWVPRKDITVTCQNGNRKAKRETMPGGETEQDPSDHEYLVLANESLQEYLSNTGNPKPHKVVTVDKVTTQVVSGSMTRIDFVAIPNDGSDSDSIKCHSEIWEQPWVPRKDITVTCQNGNQKAKRETMPGGETEQDPSDHEYLVLANESLQKYLSNTGNPKPHKVVTVDKVTTQVVSGSMTRIDFVAIPNDGSSSDSIKCHSEIWEQPWVPRKDITVTCQNGHHKVKREVIGAPKPQDPASPEYLQLANESLQKYLSNTGNPRPHKVIRVEAVSKQLVSGSITRIIFVAAPTDESSSETLACHSKIWEEPWVSRKDITVNCQNINHKVKRDLIGAPEEQNPAAPEYLQLANESLQKYLLNTGNPKPHKVVTVDKVTTQVVSGSMTRIDFVAIPNDGSSSDSIKCHSEIWEQPWVPRKDITVTCQNGNRKAKRETMPGGEAEQDPSDHEYLVLANESLQKYLSNTGNPKPHKVVTVDKVTTQVVSGSITRIDFVAIPTDGSSGDSIKCHSEIWEQPWVPRKDITVTCQNGHHKVKREVIGAPKPQDPASPEYLQLANESLQKYLSNTGSPRPHKVIRVEAVSKQLVSGSITRIIFVAAPTDESSSETLACHSKIWEEPWVSRKDITVNCQNINHKVKRDLIGAPEEQNPAAPEYLQLANESLQKYLLNTGNPKPHKVVTVDKVTTQVVSGSMTRIDFVAIPNDGSSSDSIKCHSEIWEQPWVPRKDITVTCQNGNRKAKRETMPGGETEQDPSDHEYLVLANESLQKYLSNTGNPKPHKVVTVDKVTTQVVSGSMTRIDFVAIPNDGSSSDSIKCHSEIWEQPWVPRKDITVTCQNGNQKAKRETMPGGETEQDPSDHEYLVLANESLQKYLSNTGNPKPHKVVTVDNVTTQVVSGSMTRIDFVAIPNDGSSSDSIKCHSEIWEQPWVPRKDITVTCQNGHHKVKREVIGAPKPQDPASPEYLQLANESLQKYLSNTGSPRPHKVIRVEAVSKQLVSGSITRIIFVAAPTDESSSETLACHSKIWEEPWVSRKDITVNCQNINHKVKRDLIGAPEEQNPAAPEYLQLANESLQKYLLNTGNPKPHKVVTVDKVTTQVVSGSMTRIDFVAIPNDGSSSDSIKCHSEIWEQPWVPRKDITVTCQNGNRKAKRETMPGGETEQDPSDHEYLVLANESLQKYLSNTGNPKPHKVVTVDKVTTQVVSGSMTRIDFVAIPNDGSSSDSIKCHSEIWEQPWVPRKDITVTCQNGNQKAKRETMPGGETEQDPSDHEYLVLANESLQKYLSNTGNPKPHKVVTVDKVTTQVVSGSMTRIDFVAIPNDGSSSDSIKCHSEIWEQPWVPRKDITVTCQNGHHKVKREVIGAPKPQDPASPEYLQLANESLQKYLSNTGNPRPHKVIRVEAVSKQLVSGSITRIIFVAAPTDESSSETLACHSKIWEEPWVSRKDITVNCQNINHKVKRDLIGAPEEQNPAAPEYLQLANESLQKYLLNTGNPKPHKVVTVDKVTTQVVSGSMTRIDFVAIPNDGSSSDSIKCHSEIWEQPWVPRKDITVTCQNGNRKAKRETMPGGETEQDPSDHEYLVLANESLQKYLSNTGNPKPHKVVTVDKVTTQVVSGSITRIDFVAIPTDGSSGDSIKCHSEIWEQPWVPRKDITVTCKNGNRKAKRETMPGGEAEQDPSDHEYLVLANESLQKYLSNTRNPKPHKVVTVDKVTTQVVSGSMTRIDFAAVSTDGSSSDTIKCHSEIWEQPWVPRKDITVNCQNENLKAKRETMPGGKTEQDPSDHEYLVLANESLQKYLSNTGNPKPHKVVTVDKVTTQVVSGSMTRIDFVAIPTDESSGDSIKCHSEIWEQPWVPRKDITVTCQNGHHKVKREVIGAPKPQDPASPEYLQLANESLQKYLSNTGNPRPHKVIRVEAVSKQVVSGSITRIIFVAAPTDESSSATLACHSKIWEEPWVSRKDITVNCQNINHKVKRDLIGAPEEQNPAAPEYLQLANESLQKYLLNTGNPKPHKVVTVDKVTTQVVSGSMTRIDFVAIPNDGSSSDSIKCHSEIWEQPWVPRKDITVTCQNGNRKAKRETMPGGEAEQDPSDHEYLVLANESLQKYLSNTGNPKPHKVVTVDKVTTQVVSGSITRIDFVAIPTDGSSGDSIKCHSEIWEQPWVPRKDITVTCQNGHHKVKREVIGAPKPQDPASPEYLQLANESLQKYLSNTGNPRPHKVIRVEAVSKQLVSGSITRIIFVAAPTDESSSETLACHSKIWEEPWVSRKDITVNCQNINHKVKRDLIGAPEEQNPAAPEYLQLANESLQKYLLNTGNPKPHKVVTVDKVTTQVVSGSMTRIDFVAIPNDGSSSDSIKCHSEIWEQPWVPRKDITVTCQNGNRKAKRETMPGGETEQDPSDHEYLVLANESLQKYLSNTGNPKPHKVVTVDKVTTQVVSGSITRIDFVAIPTDGSSGDSIKCHSEIWEQPWVPRKDITVTCKNGNRKAKRETMPGGEAEQDPSDHEYLVLANESLQKYLSNTRNPKPHKVVTVDKVTTQVVSGSMTRIDFAAVSTDGSSSDTIKCHSEIWEQPWVPRKDITVNCQNENLKAKRETMPGGKTEQDPSDHEYLVLANESLQKYLSNTGNPKPHKVVTVDKVTTQVVSGSMTRIDFVAIPTDESSGDSIKCHSEIWEQPWVPRKDITVTCQNGHHKVKREVIGAPKPQDPASPEYLQLANESLQKYLSNTGNPRPHKVIRVEAVSKQVVSGSITRIIFVAAPTDESSSATLACHSKIWEEPWVSRKDITVNCQNINHKVKRDLIGAPEEQNPAAPEYLQLANESLQKYLLNTGNPKPHKVVTVDKVTTQVVSGSMTRIDFVAIPNDGSSSDSIKCHSEIWEQPWVPRKDITVTCQNGNRKAKRETMPGGEAEQDPSDHEYLVLANESLQKYLSNTGNPKPHKVVTVDKVTTQVVSGSITRIDFVAIPTDGSSGDSIKCHSEIWEQPWVPRKDITVTCQNGHHKVKREVIGAPKPQDPASPEYLQLANESLQKYLSNTGNPRPHKVIRVEAVSKQLVSGSITRIIFVAAPTDESSSETLACHSKIWEEPWVSRKDITVNCQNINHKVKRDLIGAPEEQNPAAPEYLQLADESLQKYLLNTGNPKPHKVVTVDKVTTQVVSGSMTRIDFVAIPNDGSSSDSIKCHSEIWEQPWVPRKDITVTCQNGNRKAKRETMPGGETEQDPSDHEYLVLANESLQKYLSNTGNPKPHKVVTVDKVTTQVVSGSMTRIDFVAIPNDGSSSDSIKCHSEIWEQPWVPKKDITVTCQNGNQKAKRETMPGGETEQDPSDHEYLVLANESLQKYLSNTGNPKPHKVVTVDKVTTQVVSGSMTRIDFVAIPNDGSSSDSIKCHSEIWEQPWVPRKDITVTCQNGHHKVKREVIGAPKPQDPASPEYLQLANESLQKYLSNTGNPRPHKVIRVEAVSKQLVSGSITRIIFVAAPTDESSSETLACHSKIWEEPWVSRKDITVNCQNINHKVKRDLIGAPEEQNPAAPEYLQLANESLQKYLLNTGNPKPHKVVTVDKVTTQVVSGSMTRIDFVAIPNDGSSSDSIKCHSEIWEQPWVPRKDITVTCQNGNQKAKRETMPSGETEQDPSDHEYLVLANESLQKYLSNTGNPKPHKVVTVDKVTTQVVSGSMTRIDFVAIPTDGSNGDSIKCHSEIWEQPWVPRKDITVNCQNGNQKAKRETMPGGETEQDPSDHEYLVLANESLQKYLSNTGNPKPHKVVTVDKVTTQVVSGSMTRIDFVAIPNDGSSSDSIKCHSEIWEQPWVPRKDITVTCQNGNRKAKRETMPGGETEQDPSDHEYLMLANESLQKYLSNTGNPKPHKVVTVDKVTTQVVSGSMTRIDFVAIPNDGSSSDTIKCHSEIWEQPWVPRKDITVTCQNGNRKAKRETMPGGETEQDPSDHEYLVLANESLQKYLSNTGNPKPHKVVTVDKVTTQVVSGSMTRIDFAAVPTDGSSSDTIKCHSEIWEQPWVPRKDITVNCQNGNQKAKRETMPGGETEQDPSDHEYLVLANESLQKYLSNTGNPKPHKVVTVDKVTTQVVSGSMTRIDFVAIPTDGSSGDSIKCHSEIWEQPWVPRKDITVNCQNGNQKAKRETMPGGETEQDPSDHEYLVLANESLQKYLSNTGNPKPHKVVTVDKVTTQVVSGSMTRIDFVAIPNDGSSSDSIKCHSEIWEQPWVPRKDITVTCQNGNRKVKRETKLGGYTDQDPADPKYLDLANESLQKYILDTGNPKPHKVVTVDKVTTQVISGSMTRIDFAAVPTDGSSSDTIKCHSEIWEQPWVPRKDITVICQNRIKRVKRQLLSAPVEEDPGNPIFFLLAADSLKKYLADIRNSRPHKVVKVEKVTTQNLAGLLTRIEFVIMQSDIPNSEKMFCFSQIWQQDHLNKTDIDVICRDGKGTLNKYVIDESRNKNPNDSKYLQLAKKSLQKYLSESGNLQPHKIVRVEKVNVQITSGLLTRLHFVALPTDTTKSDILNCYSEILDQSWRKNDFTVSCQYEYLRHIKDIVASTIEHNPDDKKYLKMAKESLRKYLSDSGTKKTYKVIRIDRITTDVNAGFLTRIYYVISSTDSTIMYCLSEILEMPWPDKRNLTVVCENNVDLSENWDIELENITSRNVNNERQLNPTQPMYQLMAAVVLRQVSKRKGVLHKVVKIRHVTMMENLLYNIDFTASPTDCLFNVSNSRVHSCNVIANSTLYCQTQISIQHGIRKKKANINCVPEAADYEDIWGEFSENNNSTHAIQVALQKENVKVNALAEEALEKFLSSTNRKYVFRITNIDKFHDYLADGIVSLLEFSIAETLCLREGFNDFRNNCEFKSPMEEYYCTAKIDERAWLSAKDIKINCRKQNNDNESGKRSKRQTDKNIEDDYNEIDEDTTYHYADRAVHYLNEHTDTNNLYKLITIHAVRNMVQKRASIVKMYIEVAETYCLRQHRDFNTADCEEMEGINHRLCLADVYPSPDDELILKHVTIICDDDDKQFNFATGIYVPELLRLSLLELEKSPNHANKLVHQGEPQVIPTLDLVKPLVLNFVVATTNCSKTVDLNKYPFQCYLDNSIPSKSCSSRIWLDSSSRTILNINASCQNINFPSARQKRTTLDNANGTIDEAELNNLMLATLDKLEMASLHRYKQRVLHINSYSSKITSGKVTTIDFDVAYTSCLKYEWVDNITSCDFLEHLPRRHCVAQIWERLWFNNGLSIDVSCEDDETPLEAHVEFESADMANQLAQESLKHIEAKYPNPRKQQVVRIFSLEKQAVAGIHYRMKMEVANTDCVALTDQTDCKLCPNTTNKFCRVNVWVRPWTDHPPNFRVHCDFQDGVSSNEIFNHLQAEQLFYHFLVTYNPSYVNDYRELEKRFGIFKDNVKKIHEFNVHEKGTAKYGVTRFADLSYKEFRSKYLGLKTSLHDDKQPVMEKAHIPNITIPLHFDWREFGAVTDVKDQGECASSWAFSVTANIESQWKIKSEKKVSLSEQQLLDCDKVNDGCDGGLPENAYRVIQQMGGMQTDEEYQYEGEGDKCLFNATRAKVRINGAVNITSNETDMARWLVYNGPISIGLNGRPLQFYLNGVIHPWQAFCDRNEIDHAALLVGYNVKDHSAFHKRIPYWIVKNSFGGEWGDQGYFLIHRGGGTCGVNKMATSAVLED